jgi:hypothetical protein
MRLAGRFISRESILGTVETLELVEAYPDDKCASKNKLYTSNTHGSMISGRDSLHMITLFVDRS